MEDSSIARVVSVLFSPAKTFESIRQRPTWLVALVALLVVSLVSAALVSSRIDWSEMARDSIEAQGRQLTEEQMEQAIDITERVGPISSTLGPLVIAVIFALSAAIGLVVVKLLGGEMSYAQSFSTTIHAAMPQLVAGLLSIPVILGKESFSYLDVRTNTVLKSNLGAFAPEDTGPAMLNLLASIDIFGLWGLVLLAIGLAVVGRLSKGTGALAAIIVWGFWVVVRVGLAALGSLGS